MVLTTYRDAQHPYRSGANWGQVFKNGKMRKAKVPDPGGYGKQISGELPVCEQIWNRYKNGESVESILADPESKV